MVKLREISDIDCGEIAMAARRLGIGIVEMEPKPGLWKFDWMDFVSGTRIEGVEMPDRMESYRQSCILLVDYLSPIKQQNNGAAPGDTKPTQ